MSRLKTLIVDDDPATRVVLRAALQKFDCDCLVARNGREAWAMYQETKPSLVFADWIMPEIDGLELCRMIRAANRPSYTYVILVTALSGKGSYLEGMKAGADDFVTKPFDLEEMGARFQVARRIIGLQREIKQLQGLLPVCSYCQRIRDASGGWSSIEDYLLRHAGVMVSHTFCPECYHARVEPQINHLGDPETS